ncbi:bifunctional metallophosphatase/5'-nucleotidase [Roseomonas sp. BN140053]|uniref:bifunctional metallophosphatase/5'-nucleotidase n=1 Tax=Roseomonas sp. BN140053 TaxID=3391898 RepID=UPI0039E84EBF
MQHPTPSRSLPSAPLPAEAAGSPGAGLLPLSRRGLLAAALALPLAAPAIRRAAAQAAGRVSLVHFNDFHSHHDPIVAGGATCRPGRPCFGGAARLAGAIRQAKDAVSAEGRAPLLLDAGDEFTGSLFYTLHRGAAEAAVQKANGVQAMTLGNHEFDHGPQNLANYLGQLPFPVLSANLDLTDEPLLRDRVTPWTVLEAGGRRFAVIGLTTPDTATSSSPGPTVRFGDPAVALERVLAQLRAQAAQQGPMTVVLLSHLGLETDRRLARAVPGLDVIVGGHSHTLLANGLAEAEGPDPVMEESSAGPVRIVQAGCFGRYLGRLDLDLSDAGRVVSHQGVMRELGTDVAEDPEVAQVVARFAAPLEELKRRPIARIPTTLSIEGCRSGECAIGNLMADAMLAAVPSAEVAITNGGGMRAGLVEGTVTMGDVLAMLPFANTIATVTLRGRDLKAALENGVSKVPDTVGRFPQVAGLRVQWTADAPPGQRVTILEVAGAPFDPERPYRIVTNNFMRRGGDDYVSMRDDALEFYDNGAPLEDSLIAFLSDGRPVAGIDGRLARR